MSDVSTTDLVSFQLGRRPILSYGENAGSERPDAKTLFHGAGGYEDVLLSTEVNELSWANRTLAEWSRLSCLLWNRQLSQLAVREHQRLTRDAVSQAVRQY